MFDYLIIGAGFAGSVLAERISNVLDKKVLLVDKRSHIAGNAYDCYNEIGILIHKYGSHWFHTASPEVFKYLSGFTKWIYHFHVVKTYVDGLLLPIPINNDTLNLLYNINLNGPKDVDDFYKKVKSRTKQTDNSEYAVVSKIGQDLYNKFFREYSLKQWDIDPKELDASVTARIPVRNNRDGRYFTDKYQCMPKYGYTRMFENMIDNKKIKLLLNCEYSDIKNEITYKNLIFTGSIDEFFNYKYGKLPYRSLEFEHEIIDKEFYQECQQINFPNDYDFTRIVEWKHATEQMHKKTAIMREFPKQSDDNSERYYPIPRKENRKLFELYAEEAKKLKNVSFCGRLAEYKYYNMDQVIISAFDLFEKLKI